MLRDQHGGVNLTKSCCDRNRMSILESFEAAVCMNGCNGSLPEALSKNQVSSGMRWRSHTEHIVTRHIFGGGRFVFA
jgi:hypothetical protein